MAVDLIRIRNLKTYFFQGKGILSKLFGQGLKIVHAVDDVSLTIKKGRTFGLVGESGCGKSTLGNTIFRLVEPLEGEILFNGRDVVKMNPEELRAFRQNAQLIFQDQFGCLNPRMTVGQIIAEPLLMRQGAQARPEDIAREVAELLSSVNLDPDAAVKFPNEFSGGQARRIGVARAIALEPEFIMADEPTSGLDISTAATILNLMQDLQDKMDITYLWVSHNLNQVKYMSDDMAVMYLGKVVEMGQTKEVFEQMAHPYTKALISAVPQVDTEQQKKTIFLKGEIPSPINPPSGCYFRTRCPQAFKRCEEEEPSLLDLGGEHYCACHLLSN
ncbi:MAG: ABC transporter ATP-binding protein [Desulfosarcina sp.]|nr:ABC transporter ATP-binding protein [Desulfosarcina sp.]MBC2743407.1 ABC transporter ATP-binding protein [Desulfosarcina sp.]MBC2766317.1 ABC transporter ATP-binding protein [Desulfosarcina sp.]